MDPVDTPLLTLHPAPMLQSQNAFMDPVDTELLAAQHPELMRETLKVYRGLVQASHTPTYVSGLITLFSPSAHACAHLFSVFMHAFAPTLLEVLV